MSVKRGHIYEVLFPKLKEAKLGLVVSADVVSEFLKPIVVQLTSQETLRGIPTFVRLLKGEGGLTRTSYALCHELHTLDDENIGPEPPGAMIPIVQLVQVESAIKRALDLQEAA